MMLLVEWDPAFWGIKSLVQYMMPVCTTLTKFTVIKRLYFFLSFLLNKFSLFPFVWCWLCLPIICIVFCEFTWITFKCHLISEWNFCAFKSPKKSTNLMTDLCPSFMWQKSDKDLVGFLVDLKTPKLYSEINWPLVAPGQKSMFLLFFSGSTLSQELISFWRILCITSLCLVMAPHHSHFCFDTFCRDHP